MTPKLPTPRLITIVLPLVAFAALFALLSAVNRGSAPAVGSGSPAPIDSGPAPETTQEAIVALRETIASGLADAAVYSQLGNALYQRARETGDGAFLDRAGRAFESALAADPKDYNALAGQATAALSRHQFADGYELARQAHRLAPGVVAPYAAYVDGLIETGRYGGAERALNRMLTLKPSLASYSRASYFSELHGDFEGAARALRLAISAGSGTVEGTAYIRSLYGDFQAMRGHYGAAASSYREALGVDPEFGNALRGLALLDAGRGELGAAIIALREQLGSPPSPDVLVKLGEVEQAAGRGEAARRHYEQALAIEEEGLAEGAGIDAGITLNVANHGDSARAVELGRDAWRTAPSVSSADAYSWALYRDGRIGAAERLSAEAMRLGSRDPEFLYHAGMIAVAAGEPARGGALLADLLNQSPRFNALYAPRAERALASLG
jgi:tetratricopeptide (TPR) repeat protein